ncbi:Hypothetical protein R9X50_00631600 [Acrodontium crateriforme]|uniref:FAD-binding domain-containing protein n=1 Tax=Acrodontium crateriforme TaxID=150365 RepID=A0AAQ3RBI4_9PEZI|nr:Hypothetical protein R9X50_00631600 [Acrodontium crateriforme]
MGSIGQPSQRVLIIGAGITGLLIAQGLEQAGIPYAVFESEDASATRRREWTMVVHWGLPLLEELLPEHLSKRLSETYPNPSLDYHAYPNNTHRLYDGNTGEMMLERGVDGRIVRVSRRKLRALCREGIEIKFGHALDKIVFDDVDGTVTAQFANGAKETGSLIVGADGAHSAVRRELFGPEKGSATPLDLTFLALTARYSDPEKARFVAAAHPVFCVVAADDGIVFMAIQDVPDPERPETWAIQLYMNWQGKDESTTTNEERQKDMRRRASKLAEPFRSAFLWLPEDMEIKYNDLAAWVPSPWDSHDGRVTLAGDAAHAMPPHRGQGLNQAIQDAQNLVEAMKTIQQSGDHQPAIVQAYSDEVVERGGKETRLSLEASRSITLEAFKKGPWVKHGLGKVSE